jgi:dolichol-phosphate mannosyltransferase
MLISLIIPTFNERKNLSSLVKKIDRSVSQTDYEIVIVDDNSTDGTGELAEELSKAYPMRVIHRKERGLATAVVTGFNHAKGEILLVMDADLSHPPEKIPDFLDEITKADILIGTRYKNGLSFKRKIISKGAKLLIMILFPSIRTLKDPQSGFFMLKKKVIEGIELKPVGFKILLEILIKGNYEKVAEIPFAFGERKKGGSKLNLREIFNFLRHVLSLKLSS